MKHEQLKDFAKSKAFVHTINYAIIAFAVLIGLETEIKSPSWQLAFRITDYLFLGLFTIEILIRILAEDHPGMFFRLFTTNRNPKLKVEFSEHGFWNFFDFALISLSLIGLFAQLFIYSSFIQIGRLFRIFRIFRLLEVSDHLKMVEQRIMSIVPTVFSFVILLMILNYIYAIMGMFLFGSHTYSSCDFTSLLASFVTLFQVMTLDNWSDVMHDLMANSGIYPFIIQAYFVSFVVFTSIIAFNVFVAVMTSQVQHKLETDIEEKVAESQQADASIHDALRDDMKELVNEVRSLKNEVIELKKRG